MYSEGRIKDKAINESEIDTDWYFLDRKGQIAIAVSAGGLLPESVSSDMDRLKRMIKYFRFLPVLSNDIVIEEDVLKLVHNYSAGQKEAYLRDLYFMASRGFHYFEKVILNDYFDFRYYLKAKPIKPLIINKSEDAARDILPYTFIDKDLENMKSFMVNDIS